MRLKRKYQLNMPQLLYGSLSENWFLKELGDLHWEQITTALGTASDGLVDSRGERLYASFVRLRWSGGNITRFSENDSLNLGSELSRYGSKMFFSQTDCSGESGKLKAQLMSVFSTREASDNKQLKKGILDANIEAQGIKKHRKLPAFAKEYLEAKTLLFQENDGSASDLKVIYRRIYPIDIYDDINGVGLLYFASYPKISDKCERQYFNQHYSFEGDWVELAGTVSRDVHYYGNANPDESLIYELNEVTIQKDLVVLNSSLYRFSDRHLIARIYTKKALRKGASIEKLRNLGNNKKAYSKKKPSNQKEYRQESPAKSTLLINQEKAALNKIIIDFIVAMLDLKDLHDSSKLSALGIESIVYLELSEFLLSKHGIDSNPSRFYGASTVNDLSDYLLGKASVVQTIIPDQPKEQDAVAIIGMSGRFPGSPDLAAFWENLKANKDLITEIPSERWDWRIYADNAQLKSKWGGFIENIADFDASFFEISPHEAALTDPQQRLTLQAVYTALEDAAIKPSSLKGSNTGVFIGVSGSDYGRLLQSSESISAYHSIGTSVSILANRISYFLDIHGPSKAIDTACSSSLVAFNEAVKHIKDGGCEVAITGGVNAILSPELSISYSQAGMLSEDGRCKTFDERANGYVRSEGVGIVVLKSLAKAQEDGDRIYAVIRGTAVNHGGNANTLTAPNPEAQKDLLVKAYSNANVDPRKVSYIEAHGTGTPLGDPIEIEGLKLAFEELYQQNNLPAPATAHCGIGSVKTNVGHLEAAAGITGLIKILLSFQHQILPGNPHLQSKNKFIDLAGTPFYLRKETTKWEAQEKESRIAGLSSFGFGGANAHVVLEENIQPVSSFQSDDPALIVLSARTLERLKEYAANLKDYLAASKGINIYEIAYTLQVGRAAMEERLALVVNNIDELITFLNNYLKGKTEGFITGRIDKKEPAGKIQDAFLPEALQNRPFEKIAQSWLNGASIDWHSFYPSSNRPNKISLPTYPFAREHYWFNTALTENVISTNRNILNVTEFIREQLAKFVHVDPKELDNESFISDFGIDSIQINQLTNSINAAFKLELQQMEMQSYLTIAELASFVEEELILKHGTKTPVIKKELDRNTQNTAEGFQDDFAIIGLDFEIPGARNLEELQEMLDNDVYDVSTFPEPRWKMLPVHYTKGLLPKDFKGRFLDNALYFDHKLFKISVRESMLMDPQQRLLLQSVWRAVENAGYSKSEFSKRKTSVFLAINGVDYSDIVKYDPNVDEFSGRGVKRYIAANRISNFFHLRGLSETIDTACSSFFVGVKKAMDSINRGDCEQAIIAGVQLNLLPFTFQEQLAQGILTKEERTLPFDSQASGYVRSEGVCSIIIKRKSAVKADRDQVYAWLKGAGIAHGGRSLNLTAPNVSSHKQALINALESSGVGINQIQAIEAHGTGMPQGDESELQAFKEVFVEKGKTHTLPCVIGAAKSMIGHLEAASGGLAIMKSILSLRQNKMHGIRGLAEGIYAHDKAYFCISASDQQLQLGEPQSRIIGLHAYGIGGVSAFLLLGGVKQTPLLEVEGNPKKVFVLSAATIHSLRIYAEQIKLFLSQNVEKTWFSYEHFLASYQLNRDVLKIRLAIVADKAEDLIIKLDAFIEENLLPGVFGSSSLQLLTTKGSTALDKIAQDWADGEAVDWQISSLSRCAYPSYPMDKRKEFWISQKHEISSGKPVELQKNTDKVISKESKYLMLDI